MIYSKVCGLSVKCFPSHPYQWLKYKNRRFSQFGFRSGNRDFSLFLLSQFHQKCFRYVEINSNALIRIQCMKLTTFVVTGVNRGIKKTASFFMSPLCPNLHNLVYGHEDRENHFVKLVNLDHKYPGGMSMKSKVTRQPIFLKKNKLIFVRHGRDFLEKNRGS